MSGLLFLATDDFQVINGTKGQILANPIPGISLVLFYSTECVHCQKLIPIFKKFPGTMEGCQFGIINVSKNKKVVGMSQNTLAPIKYVPLIILYVDGKPFMRYDGVHTEEQIAHFVLEIANKIKTKNTFSKENNMVREENKEESLPEYTTGKPIKGDLKKNVCYLDFENAYKS